MVQVKKEVYDDLVKKMRDEQRKIRNSIHHNKFEMRKLVSTQTLLKRELSAIDAMIRNLEVKK